MTLTPRGTPGRRRPLVWAVLVFDLLLVLSPPVHWWVGSQAGPAWSLGYFLGGGVLVVLSVWFFLGRERADGMDQE
ncbi:hypothetical protein [Pseudonocardia acaciae]|uniref:hypothetical protein n=1 Tax=Pseudonocardia acaciae TaxID=551276 RepID=UPI0004904E77|nr:hypothetical protein [Pseudonocardia acaciae]